MVQEASFETRRSKLIELDLVHWDKIKGLGGARLFCSNTEV